jgi:hypothetical protein
MLFGLVASLGACTQSTEPADDATLRNAVTLDVQRVSRDSVRWVLRNTSDLVLTSRAIRVDTLPDQDWRTTPRPMIYLEGNLPPRASSVGVSPIRATDAPRLRVAHIVARAGAPNGIVVSRPVPDWR